MKVIVPVLVMLLGSGCALFGGQRLDDQRFVALYPRLPESYQIVAEQLAEARSLYEEALQSVRGAKALRRAWDIRFDLVEASVDDAEAWATVSLAERWHAQDVSAAIACRDLQGPLRYIGELADQAAAALVAWRKAQADEVAALVKVRRADLERQKTRLYFEQIPASEAGLPADILVQLDTDLAQNKNDWASAHVYSAKRKAIFVRLQLEFDDLRTGLPADTLCPLWRRDDPLQLGRPWRARQIVAPDLGKN